MHSNLYYIEYNGIDLTDIVAVREVEIPSLPSMSHSSIDMFERHGNVYNGLSYNNRDIRLVFIIQAKDPDDYDIYVNDVKRAFYTKEEAKLYCGDEKLYIWCVPEGDLYINELGSYCAECEVNLIAYDPYWYSDEVNVVNNVTDTVADNILGYKVDKKFTVETDCDIPVYPKISVGITKDTTFCQLENQTTGERILIGGIPTVEGTIKKAGTKLIEDDMNNTNGWSYETMPLDDNRKIASGTEFVSTESGIGIRCKNIGTSSNDDNKEWYGGSCCHTLQTLTGTGVKDFRVRVCMCHQSYGVNGDPERPYETDTSSSSSSGTSTTTYYKVTPSVGLILRKSASTSSAKLLTMPCGTKLTYSASLSANSTYSTISNGWAKVKYGGKTGYCYTKYLKKYTSSTTTSTSATVKNFATLDAMAIRASASKTATNKKTIKTGACIRCYTTEYTYKSGLYEYRYLKMAKSYEGYKGYVLYRKRKGSKNDKGNVTFSDNDTWTEYLIEGSEYTVDYEEEPDTADDKTGVVEVYGLSESKEQLFKLSMVDDNKYYEFTYPRITKNGEDFLIDKTVAPAPKTHTDYSDTGKKVETLLSGQYGDWNNFYGALGIERKNNVWSAYVQKIKDGEVIKEIKSKTVTDKINSGEKLKYIVIYIGTLGEEKDASGMSVTYVNVKTLADIDDTVTYNYQELEEGDVLDIDCSIPEVRLNGKDCSELIDIGSQFFALEPGENKIKVASDDTPSVDITWNDKHL